VNVGVFFFTSDIPFPEFGFGTNHHATDLLSISEHLIPACYAYLAMDFGFELVQLTQSITIDSPQRVRLGVLFDFFVACSKLLDRS
jgi:hypothetical protein